MWDASDYFGRDVFPKKKNHFYSHFDAEIGIENARRLFFNS